MSEPTSIGDYRVLEQLAEGGMAQVHLAMRSQGDFQRLFAIKRILPHLASEPGFLEMFEKEARVAGLLRHPNIVSVVDFGRDRSGAFLVMEYVRGLSLGALIQDAHALGESIPLQVVLRITRQIARGLHAAHQATDHTGQRLGLVHRDLSPQNVMIAWDGTAAIADFGVAKVTAFGQKTEAGVVKGKRGYMSPEQLQMHPITHRSDLFALGVILYEMLTLRRLYPTRGHVDSSYRIVHEPPPDVGEHRDLPPELVALVFSLLAKDPVDRLADAQEVEDLLEGMLADQLARAAAPLSVATYLAETSASRRREQGTFIQSLVERSQTTPLPTSALDPSRRRGRLAAGMLAMVVTGAGAWWWWSARESVGESSVSAAQELSSASQTNRPAEPVALTTESSTTGSSGEDSSEPDPSGQDSSEQDSSEQGPSQAVVVEPTERGAEEGVVAVSAEERLELAPAPSPRPTSARVPMRRSRSPRVEAMRAERTAMGRTSSMSVGFDEW